jgi:hypothetical protein
MRTYMYVGRSYSVQHNVSCGLMTQLLLLGLQVLLVELNVHRLQYPYRYSLLRDGPGGARSKFMMYKYVD